MSGELDAGKDGVPISPEAARNLYPVSQVALVIAVEALNRIASWNEGAVVTGCFDCPGCAQDARDALAKIRAVLA